MAVLDSSWNRTLDDFWAAPPLLALALWIAVTWALLGAAPHSQG